MKKRFSWYGAVIIVIAALCMFAACEYNEWSDGSFTLQETEKWFKFTATAATHYIHFKPGTLDDVYVRLFNSSGVAVDTEKNLYGSGANLYTSSPVTVGQTYYIRVRPYYNNGTGDYSIGFNTGTTAPSS